MQVSELIDEIGLHSGDPEHHEMSRASKLTLIRSASRDARNKGWLVPLEDDESITIGAGTWEYPVPEGFAYISNIWIPTKYGDDTVYIDTLPRAHWTVGVNGGVPVIKFLHMTEVKEGDTIKVEGQARPTLYAHQNQQVDAGMESFLRERTLWFVLRVIAAGNSELARWRQSMAIVAHDESEKMLKNHPQEFRVNPNAINVPLR